MIACAGLAVAQDKVTVPLSNASQPVTVKAHLMNGSITITGGGSAGQVVVESGAIGKQKEKDRDRVPAGMRRIDMGNGGLDVEEDHNVVTIGSGRWSGGDHITVTVPNNATLDLKSVNGGKIEVSGVSGQIEVENVNGSIVLNNVSGNVVASSQNGHIIASLDRVSSGKPMSFTTMNGKVDVTLPADTKARLRLKTDNGSVYSDFDVKMEPDNSKPTIEDSRSRDGRYRIHMDHSVYGTINGGGPEFRFETMNGSILIHKK
jgi:hypothetical protein